MSQTAARERSIPLESIYSDPRIIVTGEPDKKNNVPLTFRGAPNLPLIQADRGHWRFTPNHPDFRVSFMQRYNKYTLTTEFAQTAIVQTAETKLSDTRGFSSVETTAVMNTDDRESQFRLRHILSKGNLRERVDALEGIYDQTGNLIKINILEPRIFWVEIGTVELDRDGSETTLTVQTNRRVYNPKHGSLNRYAAEGLISKDEIIIPFVRFKAQTAIEKFAHFPLHRFWDSEMANARVNLPLLGSFPKWDKPFFLKSR